MHEGHHGILDGVEGAHQHSHDHKHGKQQKSEGTMTKFVAGVIVAALIIAFLFWKVF